MSERYIQSYYANPLIASAEANWLSLAGHEAEYFLLGSMFKLFLFQYH